MSLHTSRRAVLATAAATLLAGGIAIAPAASANNVAWNVSIGGPGFAVSAGQPAYGYGFRGYGYGFAHYRPWYRPVAQIVVAPPVIVPYRYVAPRPLFTRPPAVAYYGYGR